MILNAHPTSALTTKNDALDQRRTFPWGCSLALTPILVGILLKPLLIFLKLLPSNIAGVSVRNKRKPLLGRKLLFCPLYHASWQLSKTAASKTVSPSITRAVEHPRDAVINQFVPHQFSILSPSPNSARKLQPFLRKGLNYRESRAGPTKGGKQMSKDPLHLLIGIKFHLAVGSIDQSGGQASS